MNRTQFALTIAAAISVLMGAAQSVAAEQRQYVILPDGEYTYLHSPQSLGIEGGMPSPWELDFGVSGFFTVEYDGSTAKLLNAELTLLGNDGIQNDPPGLLAPVTAERVQAWLESRMFVKQSVVGPFELYTDDTFPELRLFDLLNGTVHLEGGFDSTPADGVGMQFSLIATAVPEPDNLALVAIAVASALGGRILVRRITPRIGT
jgi:hypothetical protein